MTTFLIALSATALWWGLGAALMVAVADDREPFSYLVTLLRRHGGRHAR